MDTALMIQQVEIELATAKLHIMSKRESAVLAALYRIYDELAKEFGPKADS